jgi:hypothetical protein
MDAELFPTSALFTLSGDQKHTPKPFLLPEPKARLPLNIPKLTTDDLFDKQPVKGPSLKRNKKNALTAAQVEALQTFATTYKLSFTTLIIKVKKGIAKAHIDLESRIPGVSGTFRHSLEVSEDGTVSNRQTKIKG